MTRSRISVQVIAVFLLLVAPRVAAAQPNYAFLACKQSDEILRMSLDEPDYPITLFADAGDGIQQPWAMAFHPDPKNSAYPNADHLYVGGEAGGEIIKLIIDRDTGERVDAVPFGDSPGIRSLAFEPRTNRLYGGTRLRIYRYAADGSSYEVVVHNTPPGSEINYLHDECQIAFHPETGDLYVATGFENKILIFTPGKWDNPRFLESYDSDFWYHPHNFLFVNVGLEWQLLELSHVKGAFPYFSLLRFDPIGDVYLGVECYEQLGVSRNIDRCWATGDFYTGVIDYPRIHKISSDYSTVTVIKDHPATSPPFPLNGSLTLITWPPHSDDITDIPEPQADVVINGYSFKTGVPLKATFKLFEPIQRPFTAYAAIILPNGRMLDAVTLAPQLRPLAVNAQGLDAPLIRQLLAQNIPAGAPKGYYELVTAFFDPGGPITGRDDAFLLAREFFAIE